MVICFYAFQSSKIIISLANIRLSEMYSLSILVSLFVSLRTFSKSDWRAHPALFPLAWCTYCFVPCSSSSFMNTHSNLVPTFFIHVFPMASLPFSLQSLLESKFQCSMEIHWQLKDKHPIIHDCIIDSFSTIVLTEVLHPFLGQNSYLKYNSISSPVQLRQVLANNAKWSSQQIQFTALETARSPVQHYRTSTA